MPIVEIVHWAASSRVKEGDTSLLQPAVDVLKKTKGCLEVYHGLVEEHKKRFVYFFIVWDTFEDHEALLKHPEYPGLLKLEPSMGEHAINMNHVQFVEPAIEKALNAPFLEVYVIDVKPGVVKELVIGYIGTLRSKVAEINPKYAPAPWGTTKEEENRFYLLVGSDAKKDHETVAENITSLHPFDQDLKASSHLKSFHVHLTKA